MKMRKLLAALLCVALVFGLIPMALADEAAPLANPDEVIVYYTNDVHTYIDGDLSYDTLAALKADTAEAAAGVLLVDAGDHAQGTAYGSMDKGETITQLMASAGYDLATLGNHEFDYGMARALEIMGGTVPYVSCNFYHEEDGVAGEAVLEPYQLFEVGGLTIAFVGVTTPESFTKSTPAYFQDEDGNYIYGIAGGSDGAALYAAVQTAVDEAAAAGADYVIGLGHLGSDPASKPWTSEEVIANTTGLDAFIDGHSHSTVNTAAVANKDGEAVLLTQTGEYFGAIGRMVITAEGITTGLLTLENETATDEDGNEVVTGAYLALDGAAVAWDVRSDEATAAIKDAWLTQVDDQLGTVIGYADVTLDNYDAEGNRLVRRQETNTGDFAADALYYLFDNMGLDVDVAIMNGGGIRNKAVTGEISYKTCKEIHTFGNVACLQTVTGQQILDALEWGAREVPDAECGGFLQVSGLTYEIQLTLPSSVQQDDKGVWCGGPTMEYRVKNVKILQDGEYVPLDLEAEYNLAGYNYTLRDLGDGFAMFEGAVNVQDYVMEDYMVLANYVQSFPVDEETGLPTITAENSPYGDVNGEGRVKVYDSTVQPEPERPFPDVNETDWFYDDVYAAFDAGIVKGMDDGTFQPNRDVTRAEFAIMLCRALGIQDPAQSPLFTDVPEDAWFYNEVTVLAEMGIVNGVGDGAFAPFQTIRRQEMVTMVYRASELIEPSEGDLSVFDDAWQIDEYAVKAMTWAVGNEIIQGYEDGTVQPKGYTTRAEAVTILNRWTEYNQ